MNHQERERQVVFALERLLTSEDPSPKRWRLASWGLGIALWLTLSATFFVCLMGPQVARGLLVVPFLAGFVGALRMYVTTITRQWSILSQFIDREAVRQRAAELRHSDVAR
ncbi:hypothetical protein EJP69_19165 [Variovorax gossypii]|uniref:Uncharacterized protein n=1 Tax=Variovorax gossypii TaxID=1679495 RepID=A0A3S0GU30_9BURK|nr:hypothetical protein [Variovorax gossypii]RTQ32836.1 hypothetical protein EJP69_19165 [Variovorax gossypii]